jgi:hypothetical protein
VFQLAIALFVHLGADEVRFAGLGEASQRIGIAGL